MIPTVRSDRVTAVLLDDGVWRDVAFESFSVESDWEVRAGDVIVRHTPECGDACRAGFAFATADGVIITGPISRLCDVR